MLRRAAISLRPAGSRAFAAAAKSVEPPIALYGIDGVYANALYVASAKDSSVEQTEKHVNNLKDLFSKDPKAKTILVDPSLSHDQRQSAIEVVTKAINGDAIIKGFLNTLANNNRLAILEDVFAKYDELANAHKGIIEATVTSVSKLESSVLKRLNSAVSDSKFVGQGKTLKLNNIVDPSIKGGLVLTIGDRTIDVSVASRVQKYQALLEESV